MKFSATAIAALAACQLVVRQTSGFATTTTPTTHSSFGVTVTPPTAASRSTTSSPFSALFVSTKDNAVANDTAQLSTEFAAALEQTMGALSAAVDNNEALLAPLTHFVTEYFAANEQSFQAGAVDVSTPTMTSQRILGAIQLGMKYGMGPNKYTFGVSHKALRGEGVSDEDDHDFYKYGCDFFRPVMDAQKSIVLGQDNLQQAFAQVAAGENVVFFANHQSEADPQVFSCMLETIGLGEPAADVTYVAGHKVTTDPLAIPFSMGRNLLCIHSKKHIDAEPETKGAKQRQNILTMSAMLKQLKNGGTALWVAPSGGRDRRDLSTGQVPIAPYDSKTIDMFRLLGNKSKKPTHYYPLGMVSYELCPPPDFITEGVGEERNVRFSPVAISCGKELESVGGLEKRHEFCENAEKMTDEAYQAILTKMKE